MLHAKNPISDRLSSSSWKSKKYKTSNGCFLNSLYAWPGIDLPLNANFSSLKLLASIPADSHVVLENFFFVFVNVLKF